MISDPYNIKYLKIKGNEVPIWTYGKKENLPIIFIHGYFRGFSDYIGDLPVRYLMKNYYVIAFDLPGFGKSIKIKMDNIEFISEVQKQILKNKKTNLFGISYGGLLALEYSYKFSSKINSIIIAGTPVFFSIFKLYKLVFLLPKFNGKKIQREILKEFNFINYKKLRKIKVPILLLYSRSDFLANHFMGKKLKRMLPNSKLKIISGPNHKWFLHRIDKSGFLRDVDSFLKNNLR